MSTGHYLVWSPGGPHNPKVRHHSYNAARLASWLLAARNPGAEFHVIKIVSAAPVIGRVKATGQATLTNRGVG